MDVRSTKIFIIWKCIFYHHLTVKKKYLKYRYAFYLQSLVARQKWHKKRRNYVPGDVVLLKDDSFERTWNWPMAIITASHPRPDRLVRVVDLLRCRGKQYRRSVNHLILLISQDEPPLSSSSPLEDVWAPPRVVNLRITVCRNHPHKGGKTDLQQSVWTWNRTCYWLPPHLSQI